MEMNSGSSSSSSGSPELLNGLKFGQKIYFEDVGIGVPAKSCGGLPPPVPAPAKKGGRSGGGVVQVGQQPPPRCQVEGCRVDLSEVKAYYSRHKVCGVHSKSPMVIVNGLEQRFCQQCSRFHQLPEFDQGKRSCRRRLAGHNERRRKPPPRSMLSVRYGTLSSSTVENGSRGGFLMDFSAYPRQNGRNSWPTARSSDYPPHSLQGPANTTSSYSGPTVRPGRCLADSTCALSLLSNQSYSSRTEASSLGPTYFPNPGAPHTSQLVGAPPTDIFSSSSWANNSSNEVHSDLGLSQFSQLANSGQYCGELEWAPQQSGRQYVEIEHPRAYDSSSAQHIDWSL
ncbi:hypothetical protein LguiA_014477 [Lonicera macranthoides]